MMSAIVPVACVIILGAFMFATYYGILGRITSALFYVAISALFLVSVSESIGRPKPTWSEVRSINKAILLAALPVYEDKIYLWLLIDGSDVPVAYVMPWTMESAQGLQNATRDAGENGTSVIVEQTQGDAEGEMVEGSFQFHAEPPQPPGPEKSVIQ
jgi:hypothetical protein